MARTEKKKKTAVQKRAGAAKRKAPARLTATQLRAINRRIIEQYPASVDDSAVRLTLLDVDPYMLHVYWNIPAGRMPAAGEKRVRVYLLPDEHAPVPEAQGWFDVPVQGLRSQRYLDVERDNAAYAVQFGIAGRGGIFVPLATSNAVRTPPAGRTGRAGIPEADRRSVQRLRDSVSAANAAPTLAVPHAAVFAQVPRPAVLLDEEYIDGLIRHRMGVAHDPLAPAADRRVQAARRLQPPGSVSSQSFLRSAREAGLRAELVFEGRVAPGMRLMLGGSEVRVAEDGSFTIRRPLAVDESLWRLLTGIITPAASGAAELPVVQSARDAAGGERIQFELHAAVALYGTAADDTLRELFGRELTIRPDGGFHITRILPRGACIVPELVALERAGGGSS